MRAMRSHVDSCAASAVRPARRACLSVRASRFVTGRGRSTAPLLAGAPAALLALIALFAASPAHAQLPAAQLHSVFPLGGQAGTTLDVTIAGVDLDSASRLLTTHPGIKVEQKTTPPDEFYPEPRPVPNQFVVSIDADVPPGMYEMRAVGKYGVSNPRYFCVGSGPQSVEQEPNDERDRATELSLEGAASGQTDADNVDWYKFTAKAGQRVVIVCQGYGIDSTIDAAITLCDSAGRELRQSRYSGRRDPVIDFTPPADGEYYVKVHDFIYRGGAVYRLSVGTAPYIDFIIPPVGQPGSTAKYTLYGRNLPGGTRDESATLDGRPLDRLEVQIALPGDSAAREQAPVAALLESTEGGLDRFAYQLVTPQGVSNPVLIGYATAPIVAEQVDALDASKAQKLELPCEVFGQFHPRGKQAWYTFQASKGDVFWIDVYSHRLGLPTDPYLLIQRVTIDDSGQQQVSDIQELVDRGNQPVDRAFDTRTDDPTYRFQAPDDGTYRVLVRDLYFRSRSDPRHVYRLAIRRETPDFRLAAVGELPPPQNNNNQVALYAPMVRKGGSTSIRVVALRQDGCNGEIALSVEGLPQGVTASPATIGGGEFSTVLVLSAAADAADWAGEIKIRGTSRIGEQEVTRLARSAAIIWGATDQNQPVRSRLSEGLYLAVCGSETDIARVEIEQPNWEMALAGKLEIPVKVTRYGEFKGNIALQPHGQPPNVQIQNLTINGDQVEGKLQVQINANAPVGTWSLCLYGQTQTKYRRNPEAADAANAEKARLEKLAADLAEALKQAQAAKQEAEKKMQETATASQQAAQALTTAQQTLQQAEQQVAEAQRKLDEARAAAAQDANLAAAAEQAAQQLDEAKKKAQQAAEQRTAAEKAANDAAAAASAAADAKQAADQALEQATARAQRAEQLKQQATQRAQELVNAANPKDVNLTLVSTPIVLRITPAPIKFSADKPSAALNQGEKLEVTVKLERLYGYDGQVEINLTNNVQGIKVERASVPNGQNEAKLVVEAAANAAAGDHELTFEAKCNFNGQNQTVRTAVPLSVKAVEKSGE